MLAMLVAYFDESGTHGEDSRVVTVAGFLGDSIAWARLEPPWRKRLGPIPCFHSVQCAVRDKRFSHLKPGEQRALSTDLAKLIAARELVGIGASIYTDDWKYSTADMLRNQYETPYHFCATMAVLKTVKMVAEHSPGEYVSIIFAQQDEYEEYTRAIMDVMGSLKRLTNIGHMGFGRPECLIPLQAADLHAYETYRELSLQEKAPGKTEPNREELAVLYRALHVDSAFANYEMLYRYGDRMEEIISEMEVLALPSFRRSERER
jgi:hypothetical protein